MLRTNGLSFIQDANGALPSVGLGGLEHRRLLPARRTRGDALIDDARRDVRVGRPALIVPMLG